VATLEQLTATGRPLISYLQHGGLIAGAGNQQPPGRWSQSGA
jgi:hypothetical protein